MENDLLKYVERAAKVVNTSALVPIAKNILFTSTPNGPNTVLKATDFETSIVVNVPWLPYIGFDYAVDAQKLVQVLKSLKSEDIIDYIIKDGTFTVKTLAGKFTLPYLDGSDFPAIHISKPKFTAPSYVFERALELTSGCVSQDELRPTMTGVFFDTEGGNVVATNGHKLSRYTVGFEGEGFILPTKALSLFKGLGDAKIGYSSDSNSVSFSVNEGAGGKVDFKFTKINGTYPPYSRVIPTNNDKTFVIEQEDLLTAVKRISLFSSSETSSIVLELSSEGSMIKGQDINFGNKAEEALIGSYEGEDFTIGLNAKYLIDLLNTSGKGKLAVTFSENNKPVLIENNTNPKLLQLIMPVNI